MTPVKSDISPWVCLDIAINGSTKLLPETFRINPITIIIPHKHHLEFILICVLQLSPARYRVLNKTALILSY